MIDLRKGKSIPNPAWEVARVNGQDIVQIGRDETVVENQQ
jgi:hypothetical protein